MTQIQNELNSFSCELVISIVVHQINYTFVINFNVKGVTSAVKSFLINVNLKVICFYSEYRKIRPTIHAPRSVLWNAHR